MEKQVRLTEEEYAQLKAAPTEGIRLRGFYHVQMPHPETGEIIGDSLWNENQMLELGFLDYVCKTIGGSTGSKQVSHAGLGTGGAPSASDITIAGEVGTRQAVTFATSSDSKTMRFTATFAAGWHTSASAHNISNIGLFNTSSGGTAIAGNTFASSSCASNQAVNITYDLIAA